MAVVYPNLCSTEVRYKGTALFLKIYLLLVLIIKSNPLSRAKFSKFSDFI